MDIRGIGILGQHDHLQWDQEGQLLGDSYEPDHVPAWFHQIGSPISVSGGHPYSVEYSCYGNGRDQRGEPCKLSKHIPNRVELIRTGPAKTTDQIRMYLLVKGEKKMPWGDFSAELDTFLARVLDS